MKEKEIISKVRIYDYEELTDADRELIDKAKDATQTSYAPFKILCRSCGPVVRWHHSHRKQPRKRRLPVKPVRGTYRTILRQRTLPGEKRGRTGHCGIRPRDFPEIPHPSLRSLPASHPWSGRTVRSPHTHPAVRRRGHLRGRLHQSPAPVAVYGRNHERIKYFSYLCAVLQTKTYIIRYIEYD